MSGIAEIDRLLRTDKWWQVVKSWAVISADQELSPCEHPPAP
jgi:hypothetical protein